jgi:hypothetical protein
VTLFVRDIKTALLRPNHDLGEPNEEFTHGEFTHGELTRRIVVTSLSERHRRYSRSLRELMREINPGRYFFRLPDATDPSAYDAAVRILASFDENNANKAFCRDVNAERSFCRPISPTESSASCCTCSGILASETSAGQTHHKKSATNYETAVLSEWFCTEGLFDVGPQHSLVSLASNRRDAPRHQTAVVRRQTSQTHQNTSQNRKVLVVKPIKRAYRTLGRMFSGAAPGGF